MKKARLYHALKRLPEARRNLFRRLVYGNIERKFNSTVSINYSFQEIEAIKISKSEILSTKKLNGYSSLLEHNFESRFKYSIKNAAINPQTGGVFIREEGHWKFIEESTEWPVEKRLFYTESVPKKIKRINGMSARGISQSGFYHIITEELPELIQLANYKPKYIQSWTGKNLAKNVYDLLNLEYLESNQFTVSSEFIFIGRGNDVGYLHPDNLEALKKFKGIVLKKLAPFGPRKIFVSRQGSRRSHPKEMDLMSNYVRKGFSVVKPHELNFAEQVAMFSNCREIAGLHGAGLVNAVWSDKCEIQEYMPKDRVNRCYEWQSYICNHKYTVNILD